MHLDEDDEFELGPQDWYPTLQKQYTREELNSFYKFDVREMLEKCFLMEKPNMSSPCRRCTGKGFIVCRLCYGSGFSVSSPTGLCARCAPVPNPKMPQVTGYELCPVCRGCSVHPEWLPSTTNKASPA
eukprot:CAMPEP_0196656414 /NCGR_PEP_ID=MMETSP1086-20130531/16987_1 /TAXON_ID=77921 /ORGANISM="Cyanoptyche  gloeocystis , Strain SAG4.97" /LENGTH=127 /DNA_ID=CAMNT_0041989155 /DNA_START=177 /DNA_END=560 /DNA_ORIENTATION=+